MALRLPQSYYETLAADYAARRDRLYRALVAAGFDAYLPRGAYYIMTDIGRFGFPDDVAFATYLVREVGVAVVPGSSFYHDPRKGRTQVRFCFCKTDETLDLAARRLMTLGERLLSAGA